jgi:hypothetical protein
MIAWSLYFFDFDNGGFSMTTAATEQKLRHIRIEKIRALPAQLEALVQNLSDADLHTHFIEGEWTVAQNVHHLADSHMNSFIRLKLILTEDKPTLKPYYQEKWAELPDSCDLPVASSLALLKGLHERWCILLDSLQDDDWKRSGLHPEVGVVTPDDLLRIYAAHGEDHIAQINKTLAAKK